MWKKYASLQSEAELCAIFKKKDYENKRGSHSFKDVLIILLACVSKTTIHLSVVAKRDTKKRLKIPRITSDATLYFPVLWFIRHFIATWNGTPRDKKTLLWNPSLALGFWHYTSRQREGHQNEPFFPLWIPKWPASVYSQQCQHIINRKGNENYWNDHLRENFMIFCQILSTNSLSKCIEISLENLNLDVRA